MSRRVFSGRAWDNRLTNTYGTNDRIGYAGFWFRIYGFGLHISTRKRSQALFSERVLGMKKAVYFCGLRIEALKP